MERPIAKDLDFTKNWINSIDKEVLKGVKVRDEKLKTLQSNSIYEYDLVDIDLTKPSCSKSYEPSQLQRTLRSRKNVKTHRSLSPQKRKMRYRKLKQNKHNNGRTTCGMRIAELAVPSKRHCIETWRSRWDTLPPLMVDRLRQIVMDQKPVVPIQDAIICFKQKKTSVARSPYKGKKDVENKKTKEIKILCGIFGFRVSSKLQAPRNLTLGSSLKPIAHVVNDEISCLLKRRKTSKLQKNIQLEIANKITIWIADILEQTTYNLMLNDFIELEKEEGHIWDIIDKLVDDVALLCKHISSSSSDVIESESSDSNPSFDKEDTKMNFESEHSDDNNYVEFENIISNIIETITSNDSKTQDIDTTSPYNLNDLEEYSPKPESTEIYFQNFLANYIDEITFNDEEPFEDAIHFDLSDSELINKSVPSDEIQDNVEDTIEESNDEQISEINNEANINKDFNELIDNNEIAPTNDVLENEAVKESSMDSNRNSIEIMKHNFSPENISKDVSVTMSDKSKIKDVMKSLPQDNEDTINNIVNNEISNDNNVIGESNLKIDDTMPLMDITSDDSIQKVKNSNINMDSGQRQLNIKSNIRDGEIKKTGTQGIHFAPANDNLLRLIRKKDYCYIAIRVHGRPADSITGDADESWPGNLKLPTIKATVTISQSVLSLGKITEDDEQNKDPNSLIEDDIKESYVEVGGEIKKNIEKQNTLLKKNSSNEYIIDKKPTNNDPLPVIEDTTETNNIEPDREGQQTFDKTTNNSKHVIDKNLTINDDRSNSANENILKTNTVEKSGENLQKNIGVDNNVQIVDKNYLIDKSISRASQVVGSGPADVKNKAIETTNIYNKRGKVNLTVEHLPVIFICPEIYTQNIRCLGKDFQNDETTQIKLQKKSEVRIWCQGLQNVIQNLDTWLDWIDNTCSNLLHLRHKEKFPPFNQKIQKSNNRKWITLQTNIDSDIRLWKKLSIDLQVGLRSYKCFYQQPETDWITKIFLYEPS